MAKNPMMKVELLNISALKPAEYNPRIINEAEFSGLVESLREFGQRENLIINKDMTVISGHQRLKAAEVVGWTKVWCDVVDLNKHAEKKLNVLMNSQAISGHYDELKLAEILEELKVDDNYGDLMLHELEPLDLSDKGNGADEDDPPEVSEKKPESVLGKVYQLGRHRIMCGDATSEDSTKKLVGAQKINLYLTDPPYNVDYTGKSKKAMKIENDKQDTEEFLVFLSDAFRRAEEYMNQGASFYIFHAHMKSYEFQVATKDAGLQLSQCLAWVKQTMVMGRQDYHWKHEAILYGWKPGESHAWYSDRKQTTILEFDRGTNNEDHPTTKPISILAYMIENSSKTNDVVFDNFLGSGSTLIACEQTDRICYGMEIDPAYIDVVRKRYAKFIDEENWEKTWQELTPEVKSEQPA